MTYKTSDFKYLVEAVSNIDDGMHSLLLKFFQNLTLDNISTLTVANGHLTLDELVQLYNIQTGSYRTIRDSDALVEGAILAFGPSKHPTLWRGTNNGQELQSLQHSKKFNLGHAVSFSSSLDIAEGFALQDGDNYGRPKLFQIPAESSVKCFNFQAFVSSLLSVLSSIGVGDVHDRTAFSLLNHIHDVEQYGYERYGINSSDFKRKQEAASKIRAYDSISNIYADILRWVELKHLDPGNKLFQDGVKHLDYDPISMSDEGEFLVPSSTQFIVHASSDVHTSLDVYVLSDAAQAQDTGKVASYEELFKDGRIVVPGYLQQTLRTLVVPESVHEIKDVADLRGCWALETIVFPSTHPVKMPKQAYAALTHIGMKHADVGQTVCAGMFERSMAIRDVKIGNEVVDIPPRMFCGCRNLAMPSLPPKLVSIGEQAFCRVQMQKDEPFQLKLPNSLRSIGQSAFAASGVSEVVFPASIKRIGKQAFYSCQKLKRVVFEGSLRDTDIGEMVFSGCTDLEEVVVQDQESRDMLSYSTVFDSKLLPQVKFVVSSQKKSLDEGHASRKKHYSRKRILEAIAYWQRALSEMD